MLVRDLSFGMKVDTDSASFKEQYHGKIYYLCSQTCKGSFDSEPFGI